MWRRHNQPVPPASSDADGTGPHAPMSFAQATDIGDFVRSQRRIRRRMRAWLAFTLTAVLLALAVGAFPLTLRWMSAQRTAAVTDAGAQTVRGWDEPRRKEALSLAEAYNRRLAASDQALLGQADPFGVSDDGELYREGTAEYQSLLELGDGLMGTIRIPKISVDLSVYHGTGKAALDAGIGHLVDTSLPVGGPSTHAVLTGHRGLVEALMFTRLDELTYGDYFYLDVMGETLTYRVDRVSVIKPDDISQLKITPGEDRVTLMTCTPYGVNTHRLLVSGVRATPPTERQRDQLPAICAGLAAGAAMLLAGSVVVRLVRRGRRMPESMHRAAKA